MNELISLLEAVYSTMDTISIEGIDNADKFVGCANVVKNVANKLREMKRKEEEPTVLQERETANELIERDVKMLECCHGIPLYGKLVGNTIELTCENGCRTAKFNISNEERIRVVEKWNREVLANG